MGKNDAIVRAVLKEILSHGSPCQISKEEFCQIVFRTLPQDSQSNIEDTVHDFLKASDKVLRWDKDSQHVCPATELSVCERRCGTSVSDVTCQALQVCVFHLLSGKCPRGASCHFGHDLNTRHNRNLLQRHQLQDLGLPELRTLFCLPSVRKGALVPKVCNFYNRGVDCRLSDQCGRLHVCQYLLGCKDVPCKFGKNCKRNHDIDDAQVVQVLSRYGFNIEWPATQLLKELQSLSASKITSLDQSQARWSDCSPDKNNDEKDKMGDKRLHDNCDVGNDRPKDDKNADEKRPSVDKSDVGSIRHGKQGKTNGDIIDLGGVSHSNKNDLGDDKPKDNGGDGADKMNSSDELSEGEIRSTDSDDCCDEEPDNLMKYNQSGPERNDSGVKRSLDCWDKMAEAQTCRWNKRLKLNRECPSTTQSLSPKALHTDLRVSQVSPSPDLSHQYPDEKKYLQPTDLRNKLHQIQRSSFVKSLRNETTGENESSLRGYADLREKIGRQTEQLREEPGDNKTHFESLQQQQSTDRGYYCLHEEKAGAQSHGMWTHQENLQPFLGRTSSSILCSGPEVERGDDEAGFISQSPQWIEHNGSPFTRPRRDGSLPGLPRYNETVRLRHCSSPSEMPSKIHSPQRPSAAGLSTPRRVSCNQSSSARPQMSRVTSGIHRADKSFPNLQITVGHRNDKTHHRTTGAARIPFLGLAATGPNIQRQEARYVVASPAAWRHQRDNLC